MVRLLKPVALVGAFLLVSSASASAQMIKINPLGLDLNPVVSILNPLNLDLDPLHIITPAPTPVAEPVKTHHYHYHHHHKHHMMAKK